MIIKCVVTSAKFRQVFGSCKKRFFPKNFALGQKSAFQSRIIEVKNFYYPYLVQSF